MTSIFIKTYPKDHVWLQYLLPSIEKYAEGFKEVVIVSDAGSVIPPEYLKSIKKMPVYTHYIQVPSITPQYPPRLEQGIGYLWQQYIKLSWHTLCDSDTALLLDSDEMLCKPLTPDHFKHNGKWMWTYRLWKDAEDAICWKQSTDYVLQMNTMYEAMVGSGFVLTRTATLNLLNCIYKNHSISNLWELVVKKKMNKFSEYNIYGSFIYSVKDSDYYYNIYKKDVPLHDCIIKNWSWGNITPQIHRTAMSYLL
jgi:hypothetical protein